MNKVNYKDSIHNVIINEKVLVTPQELKEKRKITVTS